MPLGSLCVCAAPGAANPATSTTATKRLRAFLRSIIDLLNKDQLENEISNQYLRLLLILSGLSEVSRRLISLAESGVKERDLR
jgi:hypothetical protein